MEATDLNIVEQVARRNQSLERSATNIRGSFAEAADRSVRQFKDDETYANEYHRLYGKEN